MCVSKVIVFVYICLFIQTSLNVEKQDSHESSKYIHANYVNSNSVHFSDISQAKCHV